MSEITPAHIVHKINPEKVLSDYRSNPARDTDLTPVTSTFFMERSAFVRLIAAHAPESRQVVDIGCGLGFTVEMLRQAHVNAIGIDLCPLPFAPPFVRQADAVEYDYRGTVALLCRPSRGAWIHATIAQVMKSDSPLFYVGLTKHYAEDLAPLPYRVELVLEHAGAAGEKVWLITNA